MKISKKDKYLLAILLISILMISVDIIIINPMKNKIDNLSYEKEIILSENTKENKLNNVQNESLEDDILLKVEKEINSLANIDYINKSVYLDDNGKESINVEMKINGSIYNVFQINEALKKLNMEKSINMVEINSIPSENTEEEGLVTTDSVECMMTISVK
ncbi:hypothetical protein CHL78_012715 [Romboutsia weinsteinii]|uniref:Uncharacterized protein n=1 Tax=Romboutsia weinsteinii TaxID=2020949 RepID=A0A371J1N2_9FIRM|nr:hypothetical protein [Romboutsia weinsteinii]RDY26604.1 hypothetical protein CHL78_012715 [Romboutsia weinsteinii]